jgi:hypothetical protein
MPTPVTTFNISRQTTHAAGSWQWQSRPTVVTPSTKAVGLQLLRNARVLTGDYADQSRCEDLHELESVHVIVTAHLRLKRSVICDCLAVD